MELEEKVVKLESSLEMAKLELRVQNGYIANLKVYEGIVNGYILKLKERLEELDPGCRLLEFRVPALPEKKDSEEMDEGEEKLLSEVVDGKFSDLREY